MGWFIAAIVVVIIGCIPIGIRLQYSSQQFGFWAAIGPFRLLLFPRKKGESKKPAPQKKEKPTAEKGKKPSQQAKPSQPAQQAEGSGQPKAKKDLSQILDYLPLVGIVLDFLNAFRCRLRVDDLRLQVVVAGNDPCDVAQQYGAIWAGVGNLLPKLEQWFILKKRDVDISCDFESDKQLVEFGAHITITIGRLLCIILYYAAVIIIRFLKIKNSHKAVQSK